MEEKFPIAVSVLDEHISQLHKDGVPFSLCTHMEERGLCFGGAVWTARQ